MHVVPDVGRKVRIRYLLAVLMRSPSFKMFDIPCNSLADEWRDNKQVQEQGTHSEADGDRELRGRADGFFLAGLPFALSGELILLA